MTTTARSALIGLAVGVALAVFIISAAFAFSSGGGDEQAAAAPPPGPSPVELVRAYDDGNSTTRDEVSRLTDRQITLALRAGCNGQRVGEPEDDIRMSVRSMLDQEVTRAISNMYPSGVNTDDAITDVIVRDGEALCDQVLSGLIAEVDAEEIPGR